MNNAHSYAVGPVGTQQLITERYPVASIRVDNPSGMWVYMPDAYALIPPNVIGWSLDLFPPNANLRVQYVTEPPAGTPSTVTGGPIVITTFDKPQGTNSGLNFTAASQQDITVLSGKIDVLNGKTDTVIANTNQIIANGNGLLTWTINQLTILDRAGYGGHNLSIAAPPYTGNLFISLFNNDLSDPFYVLDSDTDLFGVGTPIYPRVNYGVNIVKGATLRLYIVAADGLGGVDVRQTYGTYS
jgi:hypothetical protein